MFVKLVQGTGPDGQIRAQDVSTYVVATPAAKPAAAAAASQRQDYEDLPLNNFRAVTAKRLTLSKQTIPHYYLTIDFEIDNALKYFERFSFTFNPGRLENHAVYFIYFFKECERIWMNNWPRTT